MMFILGFIFINDIADGTHSVSEDTRRKTHNYTINDSFLSASGEHIAKADCSHHGYHEIE